ncbi:MAG: hypothetical protein U9P12_10435, partial [Verrucomicrobiota bacterium]|nr:hypothetical protein [Verrucomicrobiota bacterium]
DAEGAIVGIMDAFKPLELVVSSKGKVFSKAEDGYLVGTNSTLATGWYTKEGQPLVGGFLERAIVDTVGTPLTLNEEQLIMMLQKLGNTTCYISNGRKFTLSGDSLVDEDHEAAEPVSWAIGHDVRGTAQSLGAKQCEECHASDSGFLFSNVTATGPLLTDHAKVVPMHGFQGLESGFNKMFGLTFKVRKCFKSALGVVALLLSLIALAFGLPAIYKLAGKLDEKELPCQPVLIALIGTMTVLAATGFLFGWPLSYPLNGFPLLSHVGFGALYAITLTIWALLRAKSGGNVWFWLLVVCGIVLILSVLIAMFPLLGTHGQHVAIIVHRIAAILSIIAALMGCACAKKRD